MDLVPVMNRTLILMTSMTHIFEIVRGVLRGDMTGKMVMKILT
jgi:hypothetical protein